MENGGVRGYYGPIPVAFFTRPELACRKAAASTIGRIAGCFGFLFRLDTLDAAQQRLIEDCSETVKLDFLRPIRIPAGYRVVAADSPTLIGDVVTMRLENPANARSFELTQRKTWLPLEDELSTADCVYTRLPASSGPLFVLHGRYGGEPIDHAFWTTRQAVLFEHSGLVVELREIRGAGPGLGALVACAASLRKRGSSSQSRHVDPTSELKESVS